ncbi:A-kinase anchor protein 14 isoform X2 [Tachyglossus aculeatus]|uniref:A-kinase anchor protein 14 isoform X2 n=1 Tax=Tachyglossus aculeatus TaxID=9261 RepID=UPI0018F61414|nr:A-kinase anchor protein 14 isoform X2 [Tachyglossus aculeatus]
MGHLPGLYSGSGTAADRRVHFKRSPQGMKSSLRDEGPWAQCLETWEMHESWLHWSEYLHEEELEYIVRYCYRVKWSIPTCRKPIPRATACVYFFIDISKIKPAWLPVEVFFILESSKYIHRPGKSRFREKWLKDVIENKIILMNGITF